MHVLFATRANWPVITDDANDGANNLAMLRTRISSTRSPVTSPNMSRSTHSQPQTALTKLLRRLDLPQLSSYEFKGGAGPGGTTEATRLYGGLVLAQAAVAAARTVEGLHMHSLHAMFLRPGRPETPIHFHVDPIKQGRNFHARTVTAKQGEQTILQMQTSFGRFDAPADSATAASDNAVQGAAVEHQDAMRAVPPPDNLPNRDVLRGRSPASMPIEVRMIDALNEDAPSAPSTAIWLRANGAMPADPVLHLAALVYATDRAFLSTAWRPHAGRGQLAGASLDHSLWLHEQVDFADWLLFDMHSPIVRFERGLVQGALYRRDGHRVASVAQEGSLQLRPSAAPRTDPRTGPN